MPKEWHAGVVTIGGRLYVQFKKAGIWKQKATGLLALPENGPIARAMASEVERQIRAAEGLVSVVGSGSPTLRGYFERWIKTRTGTSAVDDAQRINTHVLPVLGDLHLSELRAPHVRDLVRALRLKPSRKGGKLASRTVRNIYGALQALCSDATTDGLMVANPCILRGKHLPEKRDKDPEWRDSAVFSLDEVLTVVGDERIPWDRRVFYALMFFGCTRFGEASELRWSDYDPAAKPRGKLKILRSYNTRHKLVKGTKAERPRHVPVVSLLAAMLAEWKLRGWHEMAGRKPAATDLIVPSRGGPSGGTVREPGNRSANHMLRRFHKDLIHVKLTPADEHGNAVGRERRQHDARRTWYSTVVSTGANDVHARWTAWGPPPAQWADYTSLPWPTLCAVVDGLDKAITAAQAERRKA